MTALLAFGAPLLAGALAIGLALPASAGLEDGLAAYERGEYPLAARELGPSAARGEALAEYTLARLYFAGQGVPRDVAEGLKWLQKAAEAGVAHAQYQLGTRYEYGLDVGEDLGEAARWYQKAADRGVTEAQFRLGLFYMNGVGVTRDLVAAHKWLNLAASRLPPGEIRNNVAKLRETIAANMTAAQVAEAQRLARDWKPTESQR